MQEEEYQDDVTPPRIEESFAKTNRVKELETEITKLKSRGVPNQNIIRAFQNPTGLMNDLSITAKQAKNLRSLIISGGTGAVHNVLSSLIGDVPSSIIGAGLTSYLAGKLLKKDDDFIE